MLCGTLFILIYAYHRIHTARTLNEGWNDVVWVLCACCFVSMLYACLISMLRCVMQLIFSYKSFFFFFNFKICKKSNMESNLAEDFNRDGYLLGLNVLSKEESEFFLQSFLEYEKRLGGKVTGIYRFKSHLLLPWMYQLVTHPKILDIVKKIFGRLKPLPLSGLTQQMTNWWSFSYFPQKTGYNILCKLSTICMKCLILFSRKNKKYF